MKAVLRNIRISPKKANLVAGMIRGAMVNDALTQLKYTPKKAADILYKVVASAAANAENNFKQNRDRLYIKEIVVTKGPAYRRSVPISRGRMHPRIKRSSHITVTVDVMAAPKVDAPKKAEVKKEEPKAEAKQPTAKKSSTSKPKKD